MVVEFFEVVVGGCVLGSFRSFHVLVTTENFMCKISFYEL